MLISCEKCSTTYVLDETLIPAAGAAVQCTRCSHVFTAFPPKPDAQATVLEEEPTTTKRRTPAAAGIPQGGRPANQTMVFGTGAVPPPAAPQPPAGRPGNQTMMFGGGGAVAPPPQPPPPQQRPANQTMVFGTPAGQQQAAHQPAPSHANPNQTLVFGASPVAPPAAQNMAFGTAAGQQAAAREPAPHANVPANQTLVFGNSPVAPPSGNANQTLVFGTAAGQLATQPVAPPSSAPANQTLVFGATPVAPPSARSTQMFGAQQPAPPAAPPPPAQRPAATTVMFGAGQVPAPTAAPAAASKAPNTTMMFGKPPEAVAAAATRTMAFGTPVVTAPKKPLPQVTQGTVELTGDAEPEQRSESTVRVDLERMMREHGEGGEGEEGQESVEQRHDRTQRFAMTDSATNPGESAESVQDRHNRTALFAMSTLQETTKPDAKAPAANTSPDLHGVAEPTVGFDQPLDAAQTIPPDSTIPHGALNFRLHDDPPGVSTLMEPGGDDMKATMRHDGPIASTMPNLPPISHEATDAAHRAPLRLDIVSSPALQMVPAEGAVQSSDSQADAGVEALAAQGRRRNIIAVVIVLLLVLAVALGVFWQFFGKQLLTKDLDPNLVQASEQALTQFRKEDEALRGPELERLAAIVKESPTFVDGHAALALGLGLKLDDVFGERAFVTYKYEAFKKLSAGKEDARRFAERTNEMAARSTVLDPIGTATQTKLDTTISAMEEAIRAGAPAGQSARARAFHQALRLGKAPALDDDSDYWRRLAAAVAVLYAKEPSPDALKGALSEAQKLAAEDDKMARPHFVAARIHLALGQEAAALSSLDKAIQIAPKFTAAVDSRKLLDLK